MEPDEATQPDEAMLGEIPSDLRDLPTMAVGVEPVPYATALPFDAVPPDEFERVCLVIVESIDGTREARLYGTRGQADHGIDLVAWDNDGGVVLYQVKRYQSFSEKDLEAAVNVYADGKRGAGKRAFRPKRFVLCVSCPINDGDRTQVTDKLIELRQKHDFDIELYDGRTLTSRLKGRPDLVRQFFGPGWVDAIARGNAEPVPHEPTQADVLVQAAHRGPFAALGLDGKLAETQRDGLPPDELAVLCADIAGTLEGAGFATFAERFRVQQAEALNQAGDGSGAALLAGRIAWEYLSAGRLLESDEAERTLGAIDLVALGDGWQEFRVALNRVADWYRDTDDTVADVSAHAVPLVELGHPFGDEMLVWVAETAVAFRDMETLAQLRDVATSVIGMRVGAHGTDDPLAARLSCCLADLTGGWEPLLDSARAGDLGHPMAALVFARAGRASALSSDPNRALLYHREAIREASYADCYKDAADIVMASMRVELAYEFADDTLQQPMIASGIRDAGGGTIIGRTDSEKWGKEALNNDSLPRALVYLRQNLRETVVTGRLDDERHAEALLGDALVRGRALEPGARHLIRGGQYQEVTEMLAGVEGWVEDIAPMRDGPPWEKASAFSAVVPSADYIDDDRVGEIADLALVGTEGVPQTPFAPHVWVEAWKAVAALAQRLTLSQASEALDRLEGLIDREEKRFAYNDDEHIAIVVASYETHPGLRPRCADHLVRIFAQGSSFADRAFRSADPLFTAKDETFIAGLHSLADRGNQTALKALMWMDVAHPSLSDYAQRRIDAELNHAPAPVNEFSLGSDVTTAGVLARYLDDGVKVAFAHHLVEVMERTEELEVNRTSAAHALLNLGTALPEATRDELFERAMEVAARPDIGEMDLSLQETSEHPLSGIRVNMMWGSLQPAAARAAGRLAHTDEQEIRVGELVTPLLAQRTDPFTDDLAYTLRGLPAHAQDIDLELLSRGSSLWARQLAAVTWVHRPQDAPGVGDRLAGDHETSVRRALAGGLTTLAEHDAATAARLRERMVHDPAWSVRRDVPPDDGSELS